MKKFTGLQKTNRVSIRLLCSYLAIILAPAVAVFVIYITMQGALLDIQKEKAQNLLKEAAVTFNKEVEQMVNVGKYIGGDDYLQEYMAQWNGIASTESYYRAYELAKSYPDYAVLNRFIRNIYILPEQTSYMIRIPQVIPNNARGMSVLGMADGSMKYEEMIQELYAMEQNGPVYAKGQGITDNFLILQKFGYEGSLSTSGIIVIEMEKSQMKALLNSTLGPDHGAAFLTDREGNILYACQQLDQAIKDPSYGESWESYMKDNGYNIKSMTINRVQTEYNQWSIVTVIPKKELLSKIGSGTYAILGLCVASILIGVAICLWYWNRNQPTLKRYLKFTEEYPEKIIYGKGSTDIWKNFRGVLEHVEDLHMTVEKQKQWVIDGIIRKILYGSYDAEEELENEILQAGIAAPVKLPCFIVSLDIEDPVKQEMGVSPDMLEPVLREKLDAYLPYSYQLVCMNSLNYTLLIFTGEEKVDGKTMKQLFEKMNYAFYSQMPVNIFTGISGPASSILAISEEYEHVCRICDYAKYYKLRTPFLLEDLPRHQHVVFTVELEMQLEKTIKSGTRDQLMTLMAQVRENHLKIPGGGV